MNKETRARELNVERAILRKKRKGLVTSGVFTKPKIIADLSRSQALQTLEFNPNFNPSPAVYTQRFKDLKAERDNPSPLYAALKRLHKDHREAMYKMRAMATERSHIFYPQLHKIMADTSATFEHDSNSIVYYAKIIKSYGQKIEGLNKQYCDKLSEITSDTVKLEQSYLSYFSELVEAAKSEVPYELQTKVATALNQLQITIGEAYQYIKKSAEEDALTNKDTSTYSSKKS